MIKYLYNWKIFSKKPLWWDHKFLEKYENDEEKIYYCESKDSLRKLSYITNNEQDDIETKKEKQLFILSIVQLIVIIFLFIFLYQWTSEIKSNQNNNNYTKIENKIDKLDNNIDKLDNNKTITKKDLLKLKKLLNDW